MSRWPCWRPYGERIAAFGPTGYRPYADAEHALLRQARAQGASLSDRAARLTVQIGDGATLARWLKLPVAYDFHAADVGAGGQSAPLVPVFHQALARDLNRPHRVAVLMLAVSPMSLSSMVAIQSPATLARAIH
jgi:anhydro-N-acetylmuramic acid kinase